LINASEERVEACGTGSESPVHPSHG
jgi:hypothetical protein